MTKKTLSLILAALLMAQVLVGCGNSNGDTTTSADTSGATTEETIPDEPNKKNGLWYADYLPEKDYEGYMFRVLTMDDHPTHSDEEDGDTINDAIYKRNRLIEEKYNINFEQTKYVNYWDTTDAFKKSTMAVSDDFDLCRLIQRDAFSVALEGLVATPDMLPYVEMTKPWYANYLNESLKVNDMYLLAYSDECMDALINPICTFFNKKMIDDFGLESPYDLVKNGTWTYEKLFDYVEKAKSDINGDGKFSVDDDRYGMIGTGDITLPTFWVGAGVFTVDKDNDGVPYFSANGNEKFYTLMQTITEFYNGEGNFLDGQVEWGYFMETYATGRQYFANNHALFHITAFGDCLELREMENDFGMVPFPKYDDSQETYLSRICDAWINIAPFCASDLERTSIILEALAVESKNYVIPAVYEKAVKNKGIRDDESLEMLDIIQQYRILDLGDTIWQEAIRNSFIDVIKKNQSNIASTTEKMAKSIESKLDKAVEQIEDLKSR